MSEQELIKALYSQVADCFITPRRLVRFRLDKPPYTCKLQIVSNSYQTNDHVTYQNVFSEIHIQTVSVKQHKQLRYVETIPRFAQMNQLLKTHLARKFKAPGHTTYGLQKHGDQLVIQVDKADYVAGLADVLHFNSYLAANY